MNIIFTGLSGSGKSTFAKFVSDLMKMELMDTDRAICQKYGMEINDIFEKYGEKFFRDIEEYEVISVSQKDNQVIATGGGVILNEVAMKALKKSGLVIYLCLTPDELYERLKDDEERPLLKGENKREKIEEMFKKRNNLYLEYADIVLYPAGIEKSRNIEDSPLKDKLGALYIELVSAFEKRIERENKKLFSKD